VALELRSNAGEILQNLQVPALDTDISWAYSKGDYLYCAIPTPGDENTGDFADAIDSLVLQKEYSVIISEVCSSSTNSLLDGEGPVVTIGWSLQQRRPIRILNKVFTFPWCIVDLKWSFPDVEIKRLGISQSYSFPESLHGWASGRSFILLHFRKRGFGIYLSTRAAV
jgi:hypothetical protein